MKDTLYLFNSKSGYVNVKVLAKQLSIIIRKKPKMISPRQRKQRTLRRQFPLLIALSWNHLCLLQTSKMHLLTSLAVILQGRNTRIEKGNYK